MQFSTRKLQQEQVIKTFWLTLTECFQDITTSAFPRVWIQLSPQQQERGDAECRKTSLKKTCSRAQVISDWLSACSQDNTGVISLWLTWTIPVLSPDFSTTGHIRRDSKIIWHRLQLQSEPEAICHEEQDRLAQNPGVCEACQDFTEWRCSGFPLHFLTTCNRPLPQQNIFSYWRNK